MTGPWISTLSIATVTVSSTGTVCPVLYDSFMTKVTERPNWDTPIKLDSELDVWERQDEETQEQYAAFKAYLQLTPAANPQTRVLGKRRLAEMADAEVPMPVSGVVYDADNKPPTTSFSLRHVKRMAHRYCWEDRAKAWDWSKNETLQGILERRRLVILKNRLELTGEIRGLAVKVLGSLAEEPERWKPRDVVSIIELMNSMENGLLSMTQLGGPEQPPQMVASSQFSLSVGAAEAIEAQTVELVEEFQRRQALNSKPVPEVEA